MSVSTPSVDTLLAAARGRTTLTEPEGLALLEAIGVPVPRHVVLSPQDDPNTAVLAPFSGEKIVLKVVSPEILHKSDVGGVEVAVRRPEDARRAAANLRLRFPGLSGILIEEFVPYNREIGSELLLGMRWTDEFGPVVTVGAGGVFTEFLAANLRGDRATSIFSPELGGRPTPERLRREVAITRITGGGLRGQEIRGDLRELCRLIEIFIDVAGRFCGGPILEFEVNPLVAHAGRFVALDALVRLGRRRDVVPRPRPIEKLRHLLEPASVAVAGVSERLNPGHIIVNNLLREGYDRDRIAIIKPNADEIEGCRCWSSIQALPGPVDLCILAISAAQVPGAISDLLRYRKAESVIVIPGGLEEKEGTQALVARMQADLATARESSWRGPVICGGNSLGVRSLPGRYDTMFIPEEKLPFHGPVSPVAVISNSGAFAVAKAAKLGGLNPRFIVSVGNQMDLTVGDYLTYLKNDREIDVFSAYVEGFRPLDGLRFLEAAREITGEGRTVLLYRAGRTQAGAAASASHTAAVAGDYTVTRELARQAGVIVTESLEELEDLTRLFAKLRRFEMRGNRLGAVSNAGFECVAMADNLGPFELASFSPATRQRLAAIFERVRIQDVVDVHNPLDLTPMAPDAAYEEAVRAILDDPAVDLGIVGCVPLTAALQTLPEGSAMQENLAAADAVASRLIRLHRESVKPWVAVVDAGEIFDPLVRYLELSGVPTFRSADRALRALGRLHEARSGRPS